MSVAIGTRVGPYEIEAAIGAGGMGEVYRARDIRLGRRDCPSCRPSTRSPRAGDCLEVARLPERRQARGRTRCACSPATQAPGRSSPAATTAWVTTCGCRRASSTPATGRCSTRSSQRRSSGRSAGTCRRSSRCASACWERSLPVSTPLGVQRPCTGEHPSTGPTRSTSRAWSCSARTTPSEPRAAFARTLYRAERWDEARIAFAKLSAAQPRTVEYQGYLGALAARAGRHDEALRISDALARLDRPHLLGENTYWRAAIAALVGDGDKAVTLLQQSFNEGNYYGVYLHRDMDFETVRQQAPFQALLKPKE